VGGQGQPPGSLQAHCSETLPSAEQSLGAHLAFETKAVNTLQERAALRRGAEPSVATETSFSS